MDSHQRLSDVADNTVCYRHVISSYASQSDNSSIAGKNYSASSIYSSCRAAVFCSFDNNLSTGSAFNQEELQCVTVTSGQSTIVERVSGAQNDAIASAESVSSCSTDRVVGARSKVGFVGEEEHVFCDSSRSIRSNTSCDFVQGNASRSEGINSNKSFCYCVIQYLGLVIDSFNCSDVNVSSLSFNKSCIRKHFGICQSGEFNYRCVNEIYCCFGSVNCNNSSILSYVDRSCGFEGRQVRNVFQSSIQGNALGSSSATSNIEIVQRARVSDAYIDKCSFSDNTNREGSVSSQTSFHACNVCNFSSCQRSVGFSSCFISCTFGFCISAQQSACSFQGGAGVRGTSNQYSCAWFARSGKTESSSIVGDCADFCSIRRQSINCVSVGHSYVSSQLGNQCIYCSSFGSVVSYNCVLSSVQSSDQTLCRNQTSQSTVGDGSQSSGNRSRSAVYTNQYSCTSCWVVSSTSSVSVSLSNKNFVVDSSLVQRAQVGHHSSSQSIGSYGAFSQSINPESFTSSVRWTTKKVGVDLVNQGSRSQTCVSSLVLGAQGEASSYGLDGSCAFNDSVSPESLASAVSCAAQVSYVKFLYCFELCLSCHVRYFSKISRIDRQALC
ncbi:hypothetical protein PS723_04980 [Pseudomonas fluorescens]|uniref:Uncharacterized protein n=1 Tax=Pseudomonas fluorescens TaxID=294 RepID=A0A5E7EVI4_PSEFL|nr:hypothetical protein PS723_04980 [Pseudomonas fluorescens]